MDTVQAMQKWECHKKVHAEKILTIVRDGEGENRESDGSARLLFADKLINVKVSHEYMRKHKPQIGGYYVVYEDGYDSFSPAEAFESGYTKIN